MPHPRTIPCLFLSTALLASNATTVLAADPVPYPDGYRDWQHIKSMVILPGHPLEDPFAGIHHIYANPAATTGLHSGDYADGAVFVFDLLEADHADNAIQEGPRTLIGVMHYQPQSYADTGGWGFEGFAGDSKTQRLAGDGKGCYQCHTSQVDHGYVFTRPRD